ncbi:type II toxin-antitoxin system RelE/ParE family toxin [Nanoarchaeota archaeon]
MVDASYEDTFIKRYKGIKDSSLKLHIKKQIAKIIKNPEIGKPMKYGRKGTRELYIGPFRLSYGYFKHQNLIVFINLYHKNEQ